MKSRRLCICTLLITLAACGSGSESGESEADAASSGSADASVPACTHTGFAATAQRAERDDELGVLFLTAESGEYPELERLSFDLYFDLGAQDAPHSFAFSGESLADCHTCLLVRRECEDESCLDGRVFSPQEGRAEVTAIGPANSVLQGSLEDLVMVEVEINASTLETTPIPNGESWCIESFDFDAPISGL